MRQILIVALIFLFNACSFQSGDIQDRNDGYSEKADDVQPVDDSAETVDDSETADEVDEVDERVDNEEPDSEEPDSEEPEGTVIIATYNSYRFFDTVCDSGYCGPSDYEVQFSDEEYQQKVEDMAAALKKINADIVLLQEIEKKVCMEDLLEELGTMYSEIYIGETGGSASVDTAVITKGKILDTNKHLGSIPHPDGGMTTFARAFLEVEIEYGGKRIIVFSAHFKSKSSDDPDRRLAEARAALQILKDTADEAPDALIVMGGDLNDTPNSLPIGTLEGSSELLRVASDISDQATYYYHGPIAIDHIFLSLEGSGNYVSQSAEVVKDSPSWYSLMSSDHAALKATFEF